MDANTLAITLSDMEAEALDNTLAGTVHKAESKTSPDIFGDVEAKALVDTLVETLPHVKAKKVCDTLGGVEPKALVPRWLTHLVTQWAMCRVRH